MLARADLKYSKHEVFLKECFLSVYEPEMFGPLAKLFAGYKPKDKSFLDLLERLELPDGRAARTGKGAVAFEEVFTVHKSIELARAAFGVEKRREIETDIFEAVKYAVQWELLHRGIARTGKGGLKRVEIETMALLYPNYFSRLGDLLTHAHVLWPAFGLNPKNEKLYKIEASNFKEREADGFYKRSELRAALAQKALDDSFQAKGLLTLNKNGRVALNFPDEHCREISKRSEELKKKLDDLGLEATPRARKIAAAATAKEHPRELFSLNERLLAARRILKGFKLEQLYKDKRDGKPTTGLQQLIDTHEAINSAKRHLDKRHKTFTWEKLAELALKKSIGTKAKVDDLVKALDEIRRDPQKHGLARALDGELILQGKARHFKSQERTEAKKEAERVKEADKSIVKKFGDRFKGLLSWGKERYEAWREFQKFLNRDPIELDGKRPREVERFIKDHYKTSWKKAQKVAVREIVRRGFKTVEEKLFAAEQIFVEARRPKRQMDKNTLIEVKNAHLLSSETRTYLSGLAEKKKATVEFHDLEKAEKTEKKKKEHKIEKERDR